MPPFLLCSLSTLITLLCISAHSDLKGNSIKTNVTYDLTLPTTVSSSSSEKDSDIDFKMGPNGRLADEVAELIVNRHLIKARSALDCIEAKMDKGFANMGQRFDAVDQGIKSMEKTITSTLKDSMQVDTEYTLEQMMQSGKK